MRRWLIEILMISFHANHKYIIQSNFIHKLSPSLRFQLYDKLKKENIVIRTEAEWKMKSFIFGNLSRN